MYLLLVLAFYSS